MLFITNFPKVDINLKGECHEITLLFACYSDFPEDRAESFYDNPNHDFDGDGLTENEEDCDDRDKSSQAQVEWFLMAMGMALETMMM